mmetsp:Transcript_19783/g.52929  ORF Transcript_19783/g.52929 Transcript_19783/m.52929 type:complete len:283 (-) Transcript_19783:9-857(-)
MSLGIALDRFDRCSLLADDKANLALQDFETYLVLARPHHCRCLLCSAWLARTPLHAEVGEPRHVPRSGVAPGALVRLVLMLLMLLMLVLLVLLVLVWLVLMLPCLLVGRMSSSGHARWQTWPQCLRTTRATLRQVRSYLRPAGTCPVLHALHTFVTQRGHLLNAWQLRQPLPVQLLISPFFVADHTRRHWAWSVTPGTTWSAGTEWLVQLGLGLRPQHGSALRLGRLGRSRRCGNRLQWRRRNIPRFDLTEGALQMQDGLVLSYVCHRAEHIRLSPCNVHEA